MKPCRCKATKVGEGNVDVMFKQFRAEGAGWLDFFFFSSRRRHTRCLSDWSSDVCSSDLRYWIVTILGIAGITVGGWRYFRTEGGAEFWDRVRLKLPVLGSVFRAAALSRFARTLGTLAKSGVSLQIGRASCRERVLV